MRSPTFADIEPRLARLTTPGATVGSGRWLVRWPDGARAFVKAGVYPDPTHGLHLEAAVCALGEPCAPQLLGWDPGDAAAGEPALLVLEDLSGARWGTPLERDDVQVLAATLDDLARTTPPAGVPPLDRDAHQWQSTWSSFASSPGALLATGLVDAAWLDAHAATLATLEARVTLDGGQLVHGDLWMQNWCRLDARGVVIVDWSSACRANAEINRAWAECAVRAAGGAHGIVFERHARDESAWAAWMCGRALAFAVESADDPRARLRETIHREAIAALGWICEACELPAPGIAPHAIVDPAWRP
jgi:hypothetical protein